MKLLWEDRAWDEYLYWQNQDRKTLKKINKIITEIQRNPFDGISKPEPLKGNMSGWWSRRIDGSNRIVYYVENGIIFVMSCKGHYED
ncbi:MAG: Txe/YoeB family addiction module toxin [Oscillospiraceae bacterium]|nr:Txe/YoeB family addiction module toxin [Oscillospiraceae bacterium]